MSTKELLKAICDDCKANGQRITRAQARAVLQALKTVSVEACKTGKEVHLRGFLTIKGVKTIPRVMPNGKMNIPRLKMKVRLSDSLQEGFKDDVTREM